MVFGQGGERGERQLVHVNKNKLSSLFINVHG